MEMNKAASRMGYRVLGYTQGVLDFDVQKRKKMHAVLTNVPMVENV